MAKRIIRTDAARWRETLDLAMKFTPREVSIRADASGVDIHIEGEYVPEGANPATFLIKRTRVDDAVIEIIRIIAA